MKTISMFLGLMNALVTVIFLIITVDPQNARLEHPMWVLAKMGAGAFVIAVCYLAWVSCIRVVDVRTLALCGLALTMLGVATTTWVVQVGIIRGDMLMKLTVYGFSITVQGIAVLLSMAETAMTPRDA